MHYKWELSAATLPAAPSSQDMPHELTNPPTRPPACPPNQPTTGHPTSSPHPPTHQNTQTTATTATQHSQQSEPPSTAPGSRRISCDAPTTCKHCMQTTIVWQVAHVSGQCTMPRELGQRCGDQCNQQFRPQQKELHLAKHPQCIKRCPSAIPSRTSHPVNIPSRVATHIMIRLAR